MVQAQIRGSYAKILGRIAKGAPYTVRNVRLNGAAEATNLESFFSVPGTFSAHPVLVDGERFGKCFASKKAHERIDVDGDNLRIGAMSLPVVPDKDMFPDLPVVDVETALRVKASTLLDAFQKVLPMAARDTYRYAINGVFLKSSGSGIELVATDGRRLSVLSVQTELSDVDALQVIIPRDFLKNVLIPALRALSPDHTVDIVSSGVIVQFRSEEWIATAKIVEGIFPRYDNLFPDSVESEVQVEAGALLDMAKQVVKLASDDSYVVDLEVFGGALTCSYNYNDVAFSTNIVIQSRIGEPCRFSVNPKYLAEYLRTLDKQMVRIMYSKSSKPLMLCAVGDDAYTHLLMTVA